MLGIPFVGLARVSAKQLRFTAKASIGARTIRVGLRVYERLKDIGRAEGIIGALNDLYGTHHVLATTAGLETLCSRTSVPKTPKLQDELVTWSLECWWLDVQLNRIQAGASKDTLGTCVNRYLLKRRLVNWVTAKCKMADDPQVQYEDGKSLPLSCRRPLPVLPASETAG